MINIDSTLTQQEILNLVHKELVIPNLIILYVTASLLFLIVGLLFIDSRKGKNPYGKFMLIWCISIVLIGVVFAFLIASPNVIYNFVEWLKQLFS